MEHRAADRAGPLLASRIRIAAGSAGEVIAQGGAAPSAPDSGHQAQSLDIDVLATAVEIVERAGPVLAV
ncbi:hypothetical protein [Azospirillum melinis]